MKSEFARKLDEKCERETSNLQSYEAVTDLLKQQLVKAYKAIKCFEHTKHPKGCCTICDAIAELEEFANG